MYAHYPAHMPRLFELLQSVLCIGNVRVCARVWVCVWVTLHRFRVLATSHLPHSCVVKHQCAHACMETSILLQAIHPIFRKGVLRGTKLISQAWVATHPLSLYFGKIYTHTVRARGSLSNQYFQDLREVVLNSYVVALGSVG